MQPDLRKDTVRGAVAYVYDMASDDYEYITSKTDQFMRRACNLSGVPISPWLKGDLTEEAVRDTAWGMLDAQCSERLFRLLNIKEDRR